MINKTPFWKYLLLACIFFAGCLFALPNLYGDDPAVQLSPRSGDLAEDISEQVAATLANVGIENSEIRVEGNRLVAVFDDGDTQLKAQDEIKLQHGDRHTVALNLVPATPSWLRAFAKPMGLGLDLRGGVHFLMEVDVDDAIRQAEEGYIDSFRTLLQERKISYRGARQTDAGVDVRFDEAGARDQALAAMQSEYIDVLLEPTARDGKFFVNAQLTEAAREEERLSAIQQNIVTLRNRVNELGVAEPIVQQQGKERIVVQLPGVQDTAQAKEILGATATLEYRMVYGTADDWYNARETGRVPANAKLYKRRDDGSPVLLQRRVIVTGDQIKDASSGIDTQSGSPAVFINLNGAGAKRMQDVTADNVGNPMAVVFIEDQRTTVKVGDSYEASTKKVEEVINVATIQDVLSHRFQTTGLDSAEARNLSLLLRAGALKAPMEIVEERTVGPSLGQDNIDRGKMSVMIGLALVLVFMVFYYKSFGVIANIALVTNLVLIVAVLSLLPTSLTLPGIAGIVLTVGMAVDANVLIFERIREELRSGANVQAAINSGYEKAFSTIADANVTTLIAAVVLFVFGTGPIKGFAVTLSIGILTSMFTAIFGTRAIVNWRYGGKKLKSLPI